MKTNDAVKTSRRDFLRAATTATAGLVLGTLPYAVRSASDAGAGLKIGVIGSGRIGSALGTIWLKAGHAVMFSSLDLEHDKALAAELGGKASAGTPKEAAAFGEVLLLAVPYSAVPQVGRDLAAQIKGKVLIDACNPFVRRDGDIAAWAREKGAGLASAELLPGTRIVRAFNAVSHARLPEIAEGQGARPGMPIAGDDAQAITVASRLVRDAGFEPVMVGSLAMGRHLIPGTPLAGVQTPEELRKAAANLK